MNGDDKKGIACPRCGCRHCPQDPTRVERTVALGPNRAIQRNRRCRHCGRMFVTYERVVGSPIDGAS